MEIEELTELFARAGCRGWLCVAEVDGDREVSAGADEPVAMASVFKVAVALEVYLQAEAGKVDPAEQVRMPPQTRTFGPTGLSVFTDEATVSVRDLVTMMMTISDNAATDVLIDLVGLDSINATMASLGLPGTVVPFALRDELDMVGREAGYAGWADLDQAQAGLSDEQMRAVDRLVMRSSPLDPRQTIRSTARETATLLRLIWRDEAGPAAACAPVRKAMSRQVTRQRLALGFPHRTVSVAAKSGSLFGVIRNEAGVITMPDGQRYAAAIYTRDDELRADEREVNAAIGAAAARAVSKLRAG